MNFIQKESEGYGSKFLSFKYWFLTEFKVGKKDELCINLVAMIDNIDHHFNSKISNSGILTKKYWPDIDIQKMPFTNIKMVSNR